MRKNAEVALKCCYVLHSYVGIVFSHNKLLTPSIHPIEMEINPLKTTTVSGLPKWQDNINNNKNTVTHTILSPFGMHLSMYTCIFLVTPERSAEGCYHKYTFTDRRLTNTKRTSPRLGVIFDTISVKVHSEQWCRWTCDLRVINAWKQAFSVVLKASP